jgi:hypothetical protein
MKSGLWLDLRQCGWKVSVSCLRMQSVEFSLLLVFGWYRPCSFWLERPETWPVPGGLTRLGINLVPIENGYSVNLGLNYIRSVFPVLFHRINSGFLLSERKTSPFSICSPGFSEPLEITQSSPRRETDLFWILNTEETNKAISSTALFFYDRGYSPSTAAQLHANLNQQYRRKPWAPVTTN